MIANPQEFTGAKMQKSGMYYLDLMLRYWFVIAVFAGLAGATSYYFQSQQPSIFESSVKIFVGNALSSPDPQAGNFESAERLALTYVELIRTYELISRAAQAVDPSIDVLDLMGRVSANVVGDTSIINITVRDVNPDRAAELANALAATLGEETRSPLTPEQEQQLERLQDQIDGLEELINFTTIQHQEAVEAENPDLALIANLTNQLNGSYNNLALLETEYQNLSNRISIISVIDPARPNYERLGLRNIIIAAAGAFLGMVIAVTLIIIFDVFDTTLRTEEDITAKINAPIMGRISRKKWTIAKTRQSLLTGELLRSETIAQYRTVLSNVMFATGQENMNIRNDVFSIANTVFTIVSPQRGNGRSFSAVNLAITAADSGLRVLLVDFDNQNPMLHEFLGLDNDKYALSRLLNYLNYNHVITTKPDEIFKLHEKIIRRIEGYETLDIILSGREATGQKRTIPLLQIFKEYLDLVRQMIAYDLVILDTCANYESPDALNLVAVTKSRVLLVLEAKGTTEAAAFKTASDFQRLGHEIDGIIMN